MSPDAPSGRPVMLYDGDCGFCRTWIARWRRLTGDRIVYVPYQEAAGWYPGIPPQALAEAVHLIEPDGHVSRGAEAVFRSLSRAPGRGLSLAAYRRLPGMAPLCEAAYGLVARHRGLFSALTRLLWGSSPQPPTFFLCRWLYLKSLALIYLVAFVSLGSQVGGLIGPGGILPAERYLQAAANELGTEAYRLLPTLAWLRPGGNTPELLCLAGAVAALLMLAGLAPRAMLAALWALYLSLMVIGQDFLSYQWDALLLEAGFLALLLAPGGIRPGLGLATPATGAGLLLQRWLLFRLMLLSGAVKLLSGDSSWRDLTALTHHNETQPLPHALSWYAHQLPAWAQAASCAAMLAIELGAPLLIWGPRRLKQAACLLFVLLQGAILLSGSYGFFNLLALALCLLLLDDAALGRALPGRLRARAAAGSGLSSPWRQRLTTAAAVALIGISLVVMSARLLRPHPFPRLARGVMSWVAPWRTINSYGLFAVMTTVRREIRIEGSEDGRSWQPYAFRYKPGDPARRPRWAGPHMPRLDWQMWFAALSDARSTPWFGWLLQALLEGRPEVLALLDGSPFQDQPPRYVRAVIERYRFTGFGAADWWQVDEPEIYAGPYRRSGSPADAATGRPD